MVKARIPGSSQELYTVSVESMPQYSSGCCKTGRVGKDLLCGILIALAVICAAVAIFLIVFFLTNGFTNETTNANLKEFNGTSDSSALTRDEQEIHGNSLDEALDNGKVNIGIHEPEKDQFEVKSHQNLPPYQTEEDDSAKPEPEPEPQPKAEPGPEPSREQDSELIESRKAVINHLPEDLEPLKPNPEANSHSVEEPASSETMNEPIEDEPEPRVEVGIAPVSSSTTSAPEEILIPEEPKPAMNTEAPVSDEEMFSMEPTSEEDDDPNRMRPVDIDQSPWEPISIQPEEEPLMSREEVQEIPDEVQEVSANEKEETEVNGSPSVETPDEVRLVPDEVRLTPDEIQNAPVQGSVTEEVKSMDEPSSKTLDETQQIPDKVRGAPDEIRKTEDEDLMIPDKISMTSDELPMTFDEVQDTPVQKEDAQVADDTVSKMTEEVPMTPDEVASSKTEPEAEESTEPDSDFDSDFEMPFGHDLGSMAFLFPPAHRNSNKSSMEEPEESEANPEVTSRIQEDKCLTRTLAFCDGILPYSATKYPNWAGDRSEAERNLSVPYMEIITQSACNPRIRHFTCAVLEPPCTAGVTLPPCRKFCKVVNEDCKSFVLPDLSISQVFDCSQYPDSEDPSVCLNLALSEEGKECLSGEFQCRDNSCIPQRSICDGVKDCADGEDEIACDECAENEFLCASENRCILTKWVCDGTADCDDGSDERNCNPNGECAEDQFSCEDGLSCIPKRWICDGTNHCRDGSDERNCTSRACESTDFKCRDSGLCIQESWVCDGNWDCKDGSDEAGCSSSIEDMMEDSSDVFENSTSTASDPDRCPLGELLCVSGNSCIRFDQLCDGTNDCADGADEKDCRSVN